MNNFFKTCIYVFVVFLFSGCETLTEGLKQDLCHITEFSTLNLIHGEVHVTAPYYILSETLYTSDLNIYTYKKYNIKILNKDNPDKLVLQITENLQSKGLELKNKS